MKPNRKGLGIGELKQLGTIRGFTPFPYRKRINSGEMDIIENNSLAALVNMTLADRVNGAYMNIQSVQYHLINIMKQPNGLVFDSDLPSYKDFYYLSSLKHNIIVDEFNQFLQQEKLFVSELKEEFKLQ